MAASIWWIRNDLRLDVNGALDAALKDGQSFTPVFIFDPALFPNCPQKKKDFLLGSLDVLDRRLRERGSRLILRAGPPDQVLTGLLAESGGGRIFAGRDFTPYARRRDSQVARSLPVTFTGGNVHIPPDALLSANGRPYQVFTAFARAWRAHPVEQEPLEPPPYQLPPLPGAVASSPLNVPLPGYAVQPEFPPGEHEAIFRLHDFAEMGMATYSEGRDRPDREDTSRLSPYFHLGAASIDGALRLARHAAETARSDRARASIEAWVNELIWREFYIHVLYHAPEVMTESFRPDLRAIRWRNAPGELEAWKYGQTGIPIVDAGLRQMLATGWMHNRLRMIAASYLVKDLLIDWREGERWFAQNLIDYDPAANNGGWQWTAGTGTDAAPYFRIFNPTLQARKFDPRGDYVRRWVPELADVPGERIHEPWKLPREAGRINYPVPMVDHSLARERALAAYRRAKDTGKIGGK